MTREQVADAQAALAVYGDFWSVIGDFARDPSQDWTGRIQAVAGSPLSDELMQTAAQTAQNGQRMTGIINVDATVTSVEPAVVSITACVDKTQTDFLDADGNSISAPDQKGSYLRYISTAQVGLSNDGRWLVVIEMGDWNTTC